MLTFFSITLFITIFSSFILERWVKPEPLEHLSLKVIVLQSSLVGIVFLMLSLIIQRAIFSGLAIFVFLIILLAVNNAKYKALNEPMVFSDFAMFSQAFKHPRLYFPFLGLLPVILAPIFIIGLIITVLTLEPALALTWQRVFSSLIIIISLFFISKQIALSMSLSSTPEGDIKRYGLLSSLYLYTIHALSHSHKKQISETLKNAPFSSNSLQKQYPPPLFSPVFLEKKPNITVIQSESFFDARRLHPSIKTELLKSFDKVCTESIQYGQLKVPAWGANTMRTEFSFLTGIKNNAMGFFRFYPYQFLAKLPVSSVASALKSQGYYCVCIHPHPASFFGREHLFPLFGFDEFIDIDSFSNAHKFGPYISDQSVTDKIIKISQEKTNKPLFIFAITMENHGPLHLEKTTIEEQESFYTGKVLENSNDLTVYLRHLKNADKMLKQLTEFYLKSKTAHTLCFYGDHIPSMPDIYQQTEFTNHHSDYLIWTNDKSGKNQQQQQRIMPVENLASRLFHI